MNSIRRILVGLELEGTPPECSASTKEAVRRAFWLADRLRAEVTFLTVLDGRHHTEEIIEEVKSPAELAHAEICAELTRQAQDVHITVRPRVEYGRASEVLARVAREEDFDIVIVGAGKKNPIRRWLFGSTAMKLIQVSQCPVWVTHPTDPEQVETILVADDFSEPGQRVLFSAVKLAQLLDARLLALHAIVPNREDDLVSEENLPRREEILKEQVEQTLVQRLAQTDYRTLLQGSQMCIEQGKVEHVILKAVGDYGVDLVVLAGRHRDAFSETPPKGGTLDHLLQKLPCSLLVWKGT